MKICRNCHVLNDDNAGTCWNCGGDLSDSPPYIPVMLYPNPVKSSERESVLLLAVVSLIVLVFLLPVILGGFVTTGQMYAYDIEPNNSSGSAVSVPICEGSLKGFVNEYMDSEDFYRISFQGSVYDLNLSLSFEDRNTFNITAFDSALNPIEGHRYFNHSGEMRKDGLDIQLNDTSDSVIVRVIAEKGGGEYMLRFTASPLQCGEYGDDVVNPEDITGEGRSFSSAIPVKGNGSYHVALDAVDSPVQIYSIPLSGGEFLWCNMSKIADIDLNVSLYDSNRELMASSPFSGDRSEMAFPAQCDDAYYLVLRDFRGAGTVYITLNTTENPFYDGNNDIADATILAPRLFRNAVNPDYDHVDYLKLLMPHKREVTIDFDAGSPLFFSIRHDNGTVVKEEVTSGLHDFNIISDESEFIYIILRDTGRSTDYSLGIVERNAGDEHYLVINSTNSATTGENIRFRGFIPAGDTANITWDFGDGSMYEKGEVVNHSFSEAGTYTVTAMRDDNGRKDTYTVSVKEHRKVAVIVGISDYIQSSVDDLNYCHMDALNWASYLRPRGYEVNILLNGSATKDRIISSLLSLEAGAEQGDTVLFIFSGHGFALRGRHFIAPADTVSFSTGNDISDLLLRAVTMTSRSQHRLVYLDSCYSGGMNEVADNSTLFIAASRGSELSVDSREFSSGLWTHYFLQIGLEDDGYAALEDAFNAVSSPYTLDADRNYGVSCHPVMVDGKPDEIFVL